MEAGEYDSLRNQIANHSSANYHLEYCDDGPEQRVKVLPVADLLFPLFAFQRFVAELASEQIHPQDAAQDEKQ